MRVKLSPEEKRARKNERERARYRKNPAPALARRKAYAAAHPEQGRIAKRKWYEANREKVIAESIAYQKAFPEKARASVKKWTDAHKEERRIKDMEKYAVKREQIRKRNAEYSKNNRDIERARCMRYKARKLTAMPAHLPDKWDIAIYRRATALGMTVDHIIPLLPCRVCGKSGLHEPDNIQFLTRSMNSAKGNRCHDCWQTIVQSLS